MLKHPLVSLTRARSLGVLLLVFLPTNAAGDDYVRQPALDVTHYEIELELRSQAPVLIGRTRLHLRARRDVASMWLDIGELDVERLTVAGEVREFTASGRNLTFRFGRTYEAGEVAIIEIHYKGNPAERGLLIGKNRHGRPVYFAENWPDDAHHWFPCIDHPSDKASVEFIVIAPERFDVVANGRLIETRSLQDGRKRTHWKEDSPVPTYGMVVGLAEFSIFHAGTPGGIPLTFYSYPEDASTAAALFGRTEQILQHFVQLIGPYPYEKLAQVESTTPLGGMENANTIFYTERLFQPEAPQNGVVPHEIAHQWFGNSVTASDWDHLWISEGFATYFSALSYEHMDGREALDRRMAAAAETVKKFHEVHPGPIVDPETKELRRKLNPLNYQKGAWVLHMLRRVLGDETFFTGIRHYYANHANGNAITEDFQKAMESVAKESLETFFRQWLYQPGWPEYQVTWQWLQKTAEVELQFEQTQQTGLFDMPVEVGFQLEGRSEIRTFRISDRQQTLRSRLPSPPLSINVDPNGWLLNSATIVENESGSKGDGS